MKHSKFHHLATAYAAKAYLSRRIAKRPPVPCISDHPAILARLLPAPGCRPKWPSAEKRRSARWSFMDALKRIFRIDTRPVSNNDAPAEKLR